MAVNLFDEVDLARDLKINEDNLELEMATCPAKYYTCASLVPEAEQLAESYKLAKDAYAAEVAKGLKAKDTKGVMKEADLNRACKEDPRWVSMHEKEMEAITNIKKLKSLANAYDMKSRMLMSLNRRSLFKMSQGMSGDLPYDREDH